MYRLDREQFLIPSNIVLWAILAFQAGFINAFGFLSSGRYVSHLTGFGTQIGIALAEHKILFAIELLGFPLSFIFGAAFSGFLTSARLERNLKPRYDLIILILPLILVSLLLMGETGMFGVFGEELMRTRDFILLFSLSFFCGMQNGCFATLTRGQIRTTHLTGIGTDIGTDFARLWFGKLSESEFFLTQKINICRLATFFSFALGSVVSVRTTQLFGFLALVVPLITSVITFIAVRRISSKLDRMLIVKQKRASRDL